MELAKSKIEKAMNSCSRALENLNNGNKRLAIGDLDYCKEFIIASIHILIAEVIESEGEF